jgi:hypothetical protein
MPEPDLTAELDVAEGVYGTPWGLGVACDAPDCGIRFEGDFLVREDSTRSERLHVVLSHAERHGWRVIWRQPVEGSLTYCPREEAPDA